MSLNLNRLIDYLIGSGIMTAEEVHALQQDFTGKQANSEALVRMLVERKKLTPYQADELLRGHVQQLVFGDYIVLDKLGQGGMGIVFRAQHRRMKRLVALKVLPQSVTNDAQALKRFEREVQAAAKLRHVNIVTAYDAREESGSVCFVMELIDGSDLSKIVKRQGPFTIDRAVDYILQAAQGLEYAHQQGVIHRDIKPANLLLEKTGTVKVLDLGLARFVSANNNDDEPSTAAELTRTGAVMGTADYMAPEQTANTKDADARSDIYSLGCSLCYLLTGKPVYDGETFFQKVFAHRENPIPALSSLRSDVPKSLDKIFLRMLAKQPAERFQTMTEVIAALAAVKPDLPPSKERIQLEIAGNGEDAGIPAFPDSLECEQEPPATGTLSAKIEADETRPDAKPQVSPFKSSGRRKLLAAFSILFVIGMLGLVGFGVSSWRSGTPPDVSSAKPHRIVFIVSSGNDVWPTFRAGVRDAEKRLDLNQTNLKVEIVEIDLSAEGQLLDTLRKLADQDDVAAIAFSPFEGDSLPLAEELRKLRQAGVHIISYAGDVDRETHRDTRFACIDTDNFQAGKELGNCAKRLPADGTEYFTFVGLPQARSTVRRVTGFAEGIGTKYQELGSLKDDVDLAKAYDNVSHALNSRAPSKALVLVGIWPYHAVAIVKAVEDLDVRDRHRIVVFGAESNTIESMEQGNVDAMVVEDFFQMGYRSMRLMKALIEDDQRVIAEMLPNLTEPEGDIHHTPVKVVVPVDSPLKAELLGTNNEFMTLDQFKAWLDKHRLKES